ncbi:hypothetical protein THAOC_05030, partial [Thalassiosira oceanica]
MIVGVTLVVALASAVTIAVATRTNYWNTDSLQRGLSTSKDYDVVIVGGGLAGISAARSLAKDGFDVMILEAEPSLGGRAKSYYALTDGMYDRPIPTDLGAEWTYSDYSTLESVLEQEQLFEYALDKSKEVEKYYMQTYDEATGELAKAEEFSKSSYSRVWKKFKKFKSKMTKKQDMSYEAVLDAFLESENLSNDKRQYMNLILAMGEADYAGDDLLQSSREIEYYFQIPGYHDRMHYYPHRGLGGNIELLGRTLDSDVDISLSSSVSEINYEDSDQVIVTYELEGEQLELTSRSVLVTASLGVLKSGSIGFSPRLPVRKQRVIDNMGFGTLNKLILYWESDSAVVWPLDTGWFMLATADDESSNDFVTVFNPTKEKGVPCLVLWVGGFDAVLKEDESDDEILRDAMNSLTAMFPSISNPDTVFFTRWNSEVNFRGSYSFATVGREFASDAAVLKESIGGLWFAGEATNEDGWHSTTVGAWQSGEDVAKINFQVAEAIESGLLEAQAR